MTNKSAIAAILSSTILISTVRGTEFHVSTNGDDTHSGARRHPLRTIQRAAELAQPGDVVTVHAGVYRERINPPRGGESDWKRIVYRAAPLEQVEIKGSEVVSNWSKVRSDVWKATVPNSFFAGFNPFTNVIRGDWFNPKGRVHHTGAVYLNGEWLVEAAKLEDVLHANTGGGSSVEGEAEYLLNLAWIQPEAAKSFRVPATSFAAQLGVQSAPCSEGGECIGWIENGDWVRFDSVDFGARTEQVAFRAASVTEGGIIEVRLGTPEGDLLGAVSIPNTGDWQSWTTFRARIKPQSGRKNLCLSFKSRKAAPAVANRSKPSLWFAEVNESTTTIWAQFPAVDPNREMIEVNARPTVFYPDQPGRNFITVRGFTMRHAATPWAPPTAEQVGLIGTHWSKGWVIENNVISHSICSGVALGKHGDAFDNTSANTAEGYVKTIERAHAFRIPWTRDAIGHHVVSNNTISHCEQTGIVGSMGSAFCEVSGNTIHDIHVRRLFTGAEMAGIKFHGAIDTVIRGNHIYRTCRGLWLDWMAEGTRVSRNLFHDNADQDLFVEVDHGPFVVDNNIFLSGTSILDMSQGGAYVHNLFAGKITNRPEPDRETPYHPPHSTAVAGLARIQGGDDRFYNNLFVGDGQFTGPVQKGDLKALRWISGYGLWGYDGRSLPLHTGGNVYYRAAQPYANEVGSVVESVDPQLRLIQSGEQYVLHLKTNIAIKRVGVACPGTATLGRAQIPNLPYENADGSPLELVRDYSGRKRNGAHPTPGPFEILKVGEIKVKVW